MRGWGSWLGGLLAHLRWRLHRGTTSDEGEVQALVTCLHPASAWSRCYSDGYRYCTRCWRVRVAC